jgi:hypothetical protein
MKRALLIFLSLILALVSWSAVCAEDGFYIVPAIKGNYAPVPKTGQTTSPLTGDDGYWHKGVASPTPRFTDNNNGTVTDNLTGLIWMQNANAFDTKTWADALSTANGLKSGDAGTGLTDGSKAGDWRLPNLRELQSLADYGNYNPALPADHWFTNVQLYYYWSSSTYAASPSNAWLVHFYNGGPSADEKSTAYYVWCVRGGK